MKKSNFYNRLTGSNDAIKAKRAIQLEQSANRELTAEVNIAKGLVDDKEYELERLRDLAPIDTTSLQYRDDFKPKSWAKAVATIDAELIPLRMKYDSLLKIYNEEFGVKEEEAK